jgi:hypothetical protein
VDESLSKVVHFEKLHTFAFGKLFILYSEAPVFSAFYNQVPFIFPNPGLLSVSSSAARRRLCPVLSPALQLCALCTLLHMSLCPYFHRPCCPRWSPLVPPRRAEAPSGRHAAPSGTPAPPAALRLAACSPSSFPSLLQTRHCYKPIQPPLSPAA